LTLFCGSGLLPVQKSSGMIFLDGSLEWENYRGRLKFVLFQVAVTMEKINKALRTKFLIFMPIALMATIILFFFDTPIWLAAREHMTADFYFIAKIITNWGLYLFYATFAALLLYSLIRKNSRLTGLCLAYLKAQLVFSFALVRFLKIFLGRARPGHGADFTFFSLDSHYNAFPSGHSADAFVSGVFLYLLLRHSSYNNYRFLPLIYAFLIAVSRVFVSAHYPSDVAAGIFIGTFGALFFASRLSDEKH
jgi:undecaprenyl-diphosphatase